ncbi:MAG: zinc-dependent metalloprotease [Gemmatimonadota bacterium]|nr:zinc-dependent metalloprotease [Gemmatimonadota bacterium]
MRRRPLSVQALALACESFFAALSIIFIIGACASATPKPVTAAPAGNQPVADVMLPIRYDAASGKLFLTIRRPGEEMLYLNTLAAGLGGLGLDRGQVGAEAVVRFERHGARVHLVQTDTRYRAVGGDSALKRSVEESFPRSVLGSFPIASEGPGGIVVDATDFFLSDVYNVSRQIRETRNGSVRIDRDRSAIVAAQTKAFPANTEIRAALSYVTDDPGPELRNLSSDGRTIGLQQHHSFVQLPATPLAIREHDPRSGLFPNVTFDFAEGLQGDYRQRGVVRWRLEPTDTAAYLRGELVTPVKQIVYYLDPAIPEPYRSAFIEGGMWWNTIMESAGWRNAFRIAALPPGVDALDARYPMIYWVHRERPGPSVGPSFVDPRTGEIVSTVVRMDSYRSLVNNDIYMGLVPAAGSNGLQLTAEQFAMARRRQHMAHEIGHTLGIAHNYIASTLGRASVMDYPYALIRLDARNEIDISDAYRPSGGAHDTLAIRYGYTWYPSAAAESAGLKSIVREAEARGLRFVDDSYVATSGSYPAATQWVEGADALESLERTMAVRRVLIDRFDERAALPGEPLALLNRRFAHVYLHHRYAMHAATKAVGGMEFGFALAGEKTVPTRTLPPAEQRRALRMVLANLAPSALRIPERVSALIPPVPSGYGSSLTLIPSPAGTAFDPVSAARSLAQEIVDGLLHPERAARLVALHSRDQTNPSLSEVMGALIGATWGAGSSRAEDAALRRVAERAVVDGLLDLAGKPEATSEVRAVAAHHLSLLRDRLARPVAGSPEEQGHRAAARRDIGIYFEGRDDPARRPRPPLIPLPWP